MSCSLQWPPCPTHSGHLGTICLLIEMTDYVRATRNRWHISDRCLARANEVAVWEGEGVDESSRRCETFWAKTAGSCYHVRHPQGPREHFLEPANFWSNRGKNYLRDVTRANRDCVNIHSSRHSPSWRPSWERPQRCHLLLLVKHFAVPDCLNMEYRKKGTQQTMLSKNSYIGKRHVYND